MEDKITLEMIAILLSGSMLFSTFLWGILYIIIVRKFETVFLMFNTMAEGLSGQNTDLNKFQKSVHKNLIDHLKGLGKNQQVLQKEIKNINKTSTKTETLTEKE